MNRHRLFVFLLPLMLVGCQSGIDHRGTIAQLRNVKIEIQEEQLEGGIEKAIESYQRFLEETPDSALAPEAIRRLADLKVEREYGLLSGGHEAASELPAHSPSPVMGTATALGQPVPERLPLLEGEGTSSLAPVSVAEALPESADDLEKVGALEAIELYRKLLNDYPLYGRNDQVLYQMSRAYEELGRIDEAMEVMGRLVSDFPQSRYIDEVQFRRAEYFFTHRRYLDAEDAYTTIVDIGAGSSFYQFALYKMGGPSTSRISMKRPCINSLRCWITRCPSATTSRRPKTSRNASAWKTPSASSA